MSFPHVFSGNPWFDRLTMSEKLTMHPELVEGLDSCFRRNDIKETIKGGFKKSGTDIINY